MLAAAAQEAQLPPAPTPALQARATPVLQAAPVVTTPSVIPTASDLRGDKARRHYRPESHARGDPTGRDPLGKTSKIQKKVKN